MCEGALAAARIPGRGVPVRAACAQLRGLGEAGLAAAAAAALHLAWLLLCGVWLWMLCCGMWASEHRLNLSLTGAGQEAESARNTHTHTHTCPGTSLCTAPMHAHAKSSAIFTIAQAHTCRYVPVPHACFCLCGYAPCMHACMRACMDVCMYVCVLTLLRRLFVASSSDSLSSIRTTSSARLCFTVGPSFLLALPL